MSGNHESHTKKSSIRRIFEGYASSDFLLKKWLVLSGILFWGCLILSGIFYPPEEHFSIMTHSISFLGNWLDNPFPGWFFFSIAMCFVGVSFIPLGMYISRRMRVVCKNTAKFCTLLYLMGCFGVFFVGIFSDVGEIELWGIGIDQYHNVVSSLGFGGIGLAILFYAFFPHRDKRKPVDQRYFTDRKILIPNLVLLVGLMGMAFSQLGRLILGYDDFPGPGLFSFTFWEWMLLVAIWVYHPLIVAFLPKSVPSSQTVTH